jgi:hypothetical protein
LLVVLASAIAFGGIPTLDRDDRRRVLLGAVWLVLGFRRDHLAADPIESLRGLSQRGRGARDGRDSYRRRATAAHQRAWRLANAALILPFLLLPVYWQRNVRWTELRELSNETIRAIQAEHSHRTPSWSSRTISQRGRTSATSSAPCCPRRRR